jgi:hypothetical protein
MAKGKLRATRHNGRAGKNGIFKAGHNDRSFNIENADHIDEDRSKFNFYWDCYQGLNAVDANGTRPQFQYNFEQVELMFYREKFGDSIDAQNERHTKSRHTERIRGTKDIYENGKTCPEETVYQLGTKDGSADPALFVTVVTELFEEIQKRFGSNVQILDWALHMDEETPHIHERHVFYADDGYGMLFPKQEKACEELGFERPDPERKQGKNNNRKMSYDEEIRKIYIQIAEKHGIVIEKVPLDGKKHLEKNDFILARQKEEIAKKQAKLTEITMKISDVEGMVDDVSKAAYQKACEVVADTVREKTTKEDIKLIEDYRNDILRQGNGNDTQKRIADKVLTKSMNILRTRGREILEKVKRTLSSPVTQKKNEDEIKTTARISLHDRLKRAQMQAAENNAVRHNTPEKRKEQSL